MSSDLASGPFSQFIVYGQKLHNLTWFLIVFSGYPIFDSRPSHRQLSLGHPIFGYPSLSSRSDFGSCLSCLYMLFESSCCINHPGLINTLPRLTCSWSVLVVSLIRFTGFGAFLIQRHVGPSNKPRRTSPRRSCIYFSDLRVGASRTCI